MRYLSRMGHPGLWLAVWAALATAAARGGESTTPASLPAPIAMRMALFAYDRSADWHLNERGIEHRGAVAVHDITFVAVPGDDAKPLAAFLVVPDGKGPFAGALWVHWLGEPATSNRTEFLDEAIALAPQGVVSLLVDAMWSVPHWYKERVLADDYANAVRQVVALRRAMDLLVSRSSVDRSRIGVIAHDYGAMYSAIAAGVDSRARAYVFIAATSSLVDWAFYVKQPASMDDYLRQNRPLALTDYLREVKGGHFFMQFAQRDEYVPLDKAREFFAAAPEPKQMKVYEGAGHEMTVPAAIKADRDAWLAHELGLK